MIGAGLVILAGIMVALGLLLDFWAAIAAPLGYQDETGFHAGAPKAEEDESWAPANPS
jgi:hypothetical protein